MTATEGDDDIVLIREAVANVCRRFDDDYWLACDRAHRFPIEFYTALADGGWIGIAIPEHYGGGGRGISHAAAILEEVAASGACMNGASAIHLSIFGMHPVVVHGSEEMKQRYLPDVATGSCTSRSASPSPTPPRTPRASRPERSATAITTS